MTIKLNDRLTFIDAQRASYDVKRTVIVDFYFAMEKVFDCMARVATFFACVYCFVGNYFFLTGNTN